jgi:hypothetical protein
MNALIWFVILYWVISVGIGLYAARYVNSSKDYALAGRSLPMYVVTATVFATWFGSETVLGISSTFVKEGLRGVVADPFGSSLCLILVGLFFARPLYRMNLLTIGDYYKKKFGRAVEVLVTICIVISYLGWVAAQIKALGLVFNVVSGGYIPMNVGMIIGAASVLVYTLMGGMWSVAITDFLQMIIIVIGMLYIGWEVSGMVGGAGAVITHAANAGKLDFWPAPTGREMLWFFAAWITMMLGSIPQQDVFQRVSSSKNENRRSRVGSGRRDVFLFRIHPDVSGIFGHADRSEDGRRPDRQRPAADSADLDHDQSSGIRAGNVLRCASLRNQELRERDIIGAFHYIHGKYPEGNHSQTKRQTVFIADARSRSGVYRDCHNVRDEYPVEYL